MNNELKKLADYISTQMDNLVISTDVAHGELNIVARADKIVQFLTFLRDDPECQCQTLVDVCGVDYPERAKRFDVVYHLLSYTKNHRLRVKIETDAQTPVDSVVSVYNSANWFEREAWDMYGILFNNHPDLRRILTDYGFQGHPLRKDFPLTGFVEVRYSEEEERVVYEPVELRQDFRSFDFMSPWEGTDYKLPGDEKAETEEEGAN